MHEGTYTANGVRLAAASATLDVLIKTNSLKTIEETGQKIMSLLARVFAKHSVPLSF